MTSENTLYKRATDSLINSYGSNPPPPSIIERDWLTLVYELIEKENRSRKSKQQIKYPQQLPNEVIADFLLAYIPVCRIPFSTTEPEKNSFLYFYKDSGAKKGIYTKDESEFETLIREFNRSVKKSNIVEIISNVNSRAPVRNKNSDKDLVPVNNGIFDYSTKTLREFDPNFVFTSKSPVNYNPNAQNINLHNDDDGTDWDVESWMNELSDDPEVVELLWQLLGAVVRINHNFNRCVALHGEAGAGGKSSLLTLMRALSGEENTASIPFSAFSRDFCLETLLTSTAILTDEVSVGEGYQKNSEVFKAIITADPIFLSRKFKTNLTTRLRLFMCFCLNGMINFGDKSGSLARRLLFIPLTKSFKNNDRRYIKEEYLSSNKDVLEYVLYKILHSNYYEFSEPASCKLLMDEFLENSRPVLSFLREILPNWANDFAPFELLYAIFLKWLKATHPSSNPIKSNTFYKEVRELLSAFPDWVVEKNPVPTRNNLNNPEPLLEQYSIYEWLDYNASLGISQIKATASSYRGISRVQHATP